MGSYSYRYCSLLQFPSAYLRGATYVCRMHSRACWRLGVPLVLAACAHHFMFRAGAAAGAGAAMAATIRTNFTTLNGAKLRGPFPATDTVPARDLWAEQPCLVFVVRRMG